jgi:hypothetical protein
MPVRASTFRSPLILTNMTALPPPGTTGTRTIYHPGNVRLHDLTLFVQQGQGGALTTPAPASKQQIIDAIQKVEIVIGTQILRTFTARDLLIRQEILGYMQIGGADGAGQGALTVYFSNPLAATVLGEETTSWDLRGIPEVQVRVTIAMPSAGTFFDIRAVSSVDNVANVDDKGIYFGRFVREVVQNDTIGGGRQSYFLLPRTRPFARLWMFGDNLPTRVILRFNGIDIYDVTQTAVQPELAMAFAKHGKVPLLKADGTVSTVWPLILNLTEQITEYLDVRATDQLELITEKSASGDITFLIEQQSSGLA